MSTNRKSPSGVKISWQDPVAQAALLPTSGNKRGDARVALDTLSIWIWNGTVWTTGGAAEDHKVAVTAMDAAPNFLGSKIVAGANVSLAVLNPGGDEKLQIVVPSAPPTLHAPTHRPASGTDPLATAAPTQGIGGGNSAGTGDAFARNDHDHALRETGGPTDLTIGAVPNMSVLARVGLSIVGVPPAFTPLPHAASHAPASGTDPLATAAPTQGIGGGNSTGAGDAFARNDHDHTLRETGGPTNLTIGAIGNGQLIQRVAGSIVGIPNDTSCVPKPVSLTNAQSTRALPATFEGGAYIIPKKLVATSLNGRMTAAGGAGAVIRYAIYQVPGGCLAGVASLLATGIFTSVGAAATNFSIALGGVTIEAGYVFVVCGLGAAAPAFTSRVYNAVAIDLINQNAAGLVPVQFTTAISSLVAPPATLDPSVSGTLVTTDVLPIIRFS